MRHFYYLSYASHHTIFCWVYKAQTCLLTQLWRKWFSGLIALSYCFSMMNIFSGHILCILMKCFNTSVDYKMNQTIMSWTLFHIHVFVVLWNVSSSLDKICFSFVAHRRPCTTITMWLVWFHALYKHLLQHSLTLVIILECWAIKP